MIPKKLNIINQAGNGAICRSTGSQRRLFQLSAVTLCAWLFMLMVPTSSLGLTASAMQDQTCAGFRSPGMTCTAGEFTVAPVFSAAPGTSPFCIAGQSFSFQVDLRLTGTNADRYNIGFFTGQQGNDPTASTAGNICSVATFPTTPSPWINLDSNACGDFLAGGSLTTTVNQIKVLCQGDITGALQIPYVVTYSQNSSTCTGPTDVTNGSPSKCNTGISSVSGTVKVYSGAYVDVTKQTAPDGDTQPFTFTATGPAGSKVIALTGATLTATTATGGTYTPADMASATNTTTVTLTDGQTARFYINALAANQTMTITESATTNWETTAAITCSDVTGTPARTINNATRVITAALNTTNSAAACTVTNTKRATVTKAFSPAIIAPGGTSDLTFTINNYAAVPKQFILKDNTTDAPAAWPAGMTVVGTIAPIWKSNNCSIQGSLRNATNTGSLTAANSIDGFQLINATAPANSSCSLVLTVTVPTTGNKSNSTTGVYDTATGLTGPVSNTATLVVAYPPTVSKAFAPANILSGGNSNMTVTIGNTNGGAIALTNLFTDSFPAGMTIGTAGNTGTCSGVTATAGASNFTIANGTSIPSGGCTVIVNVTSSMVGASVNTIAAGALQTTAAGNVAPATATVTVLTPPTIAKAFGAPSIGLNATTALNLTVTNPNTTTALSGIAFTDTLPAGLTAVNGSTATCGGNLVITGTNLLTFTGGTLAASGSCVVSATVTGTTTGVKSNTTTAVTASGPIALTGAVSNTTSVTVSAAPTIAKSFAAANVAVGGSVNTSFLITNGNATALSGIAFTDTLPAGLSATNGSTPTCGGNIVITLGNVLTFTGGTLAASPANCTITVPVTGTAVGVKNNTTGVISSTESGNGLASNTATVNVYAPPTVTKLFTPANIATGGTSIMNITVTNPAANPGSLTGVSISDTYAGTLKNNAAGGVVCSGAGSATLTGGVNLGTTVGFNAGTIVPGGTCTITQSVTATATVNNSTTAPTATGPVALTGTAAGPITLTTYTLPTIAKAFATPVDVYATSTMTFTLNNTNGGPVTSANFTDTLTGFTVAAPATIGGTCSGVTNSPALAAGATALNLTVPNLAAGNCTITIPVSASSAGSYSNTTSGITTVQTGATVGLPSNTATLTVIFLPLQVTKSPNVMTASPGASVTYTIGYGNPNATTKLQSIVVTDPVPLYTSYVSASCGPLPATITTCNIVFTAPPAGLGNGIATWTLGGKLDAGSSGFVLLTVRIQ